MQLSGFISGGGRKRVHEREEENYSVERQYSFVRHRDDAKLKLARAEG